MGEARENQMASHASRITAFGEVLQVATDQLRALGPSTTPNWRSQVANCYATATATKRPEVPTALSEAATTARVSAPRPVRTR